jgi:hypothetical protein
MNLSIRNLPTDSTPKPYAPAKPHARERDCYYRYKKFQTV